MIKFRYDGIDIDLRCSIAIASYNQLILCVACKAFKVIRCLRLARATDGALTVSVSRLACEALPDDFKVANDENLKEVRGSQI